MKGPQGGSGRYRSAASMARLRRWALAFADATAVAVAIALAAEFGRVDSENWAWAALAIPVWILVAKINSLYDQDHRRISHSTSEEIPALVATASITLVIVKLLSELLTSTELPSSALITVGIVSVFLAHPVPGCGEAPAPAVGGARKNGFGRIGG